jgi:hypothetical protein
LVAQATTDRPAGALADQPTFQSSPVEPKTYGTLSETVFQLSAAAFHGIDSASTYDEDLQGYVFCGGAGQHRLTAPLNLPNGALLDSVGLYFIDANVDANVLVQIFEFTGTTSPGLAYVGPVVSSSGSPGAGFTSSSVSPAKQIDNSNQYMVYVYLGSDSTLKFKGVRVTYKLQVSPAPLTPTFADVPTSHTYFRAIEALAASGITGGCGSGNFCPNQNITRGEAAAFFARALGLHFPN